MADWLKERGIDPADVDRVGIRYDTPIDVDVTPPRWRLARSGLLTVWLAMKRAGWQEQVMVRIHPDEITFRIPMPRKNPPPPGAGASRRPGGG